MNSKSESLFKEHIIRCNVVNYKMMLEKRFSNNETLVENLTQKFSGLACLSITVYNYFSLTSFAKLNAAYIPDIGLLST